ncbi:MAG: CDP-glucose 4,6-dehydratase [Elusimicrobiota bacterium]
MKKVFNNEFKGKKVLITGHTGFKGSWLSIWLKELGAEVIGYALEPYTKKDNFVMAGLPDKMVDIRGDVRDVEKLKSVFKQYVPDIAIHMAAQPLVRLSYEIPRETYEINVMGTVNFFEAVRETESIKVALNVTSDKSYENREWVWGYRENDVLCGHDPYSNSKSCSDMVTVAYIKSFFSGKDCKKQQKAVASVRSGNVIGGGDWAQDRVVPDCIRSLESGEEIRIRNYNSTRPWQLVLEPLSGYLWLIVKMLQEPDKYQGAWNFGPEYESVVCVGDIVKKVIRCYGNGRCREDPEKDSPHEAGLLALDISKAKKYLAWMPALSIDEAVDMTVEWYKKYRQEDVYGICVNQINRFVKKAISKNIEWAN